MVSQKYKRTAAEQCVYFQRFQDDNFVLLFYMDDMLIVGQDDAVIKELTEELSKFFHVKDLGPTDPILGMKFVHYKKAK